MLGVFCHHISVITCTWCRPAWPETGAQSVTCWLYPLTENCLHNGTHLFHHSLYCLRKVAPILQGCIIVRSQYFLWMEKKSILHRKMYSWRKKKAFCTPFLMFEIRLKKSWKHWGMFHFPVNCTSIYLPYLVCYILYVHTALQQNVILKIWIIKLWSVYDG